MKIPSVAGLFISAISLLSCARTPAPSADAPNSIYAYKVPALDGSTIDFSQYKGKKIMVVNTASECGYTRQYAGLQKLYTQYKDNLVIVGFPSNDFMGQEPGSNEEISTFCQKNYGVTFPMAAKISVKGAEVAPIYQWLTNKSLNGFDNSTVKWNFQKYLINEQGKLIHIFSTQTEPDAPEIVAAINQ